MAPDSMERACGALRDCHHVVHHDTLLATPRLPRWRYQRCHCRHAPAAFSLSSGISHAPALAPISPERGIEGRAQGNLGETAPVTPHRTSFRFIALA